MSSSTHTTVLNTPSAAPQNLKATRSLRRAEGSRGTGAVYPWVQKMPGFWVGREHQRQHHCQHDRRNQHHLDYFLRLQLPLCRNTSLSCISRHESHHWHRIWHRPSGVKRGETEKTRVSRLMHAQGAASYVSHAYRKS